jgi:hypothetical protein
MKATPQKEYGDENVALTMRMSGGGRRRMR